MFARDRYQCRYCGQRLVLTAVLRLLSRLYPDRLPYHPGWKASETHPAYVALATTIDHVDPAARGGGADAANLVCACWTCNRRKSDATLAEIRWTLREPADPDWDGLSSVFAPLWRSAGSPRLPDDDGTWLRAVS